MWGLGGRGKEEGSKGAGGVRGLCAEKKKPRLKRGRCVEMVLPPDAGSTGGEWRHWGRKKVIQGGRMSKID